MKQFTIFARTDEGQLEPYGYSTDKATALGNLILNMHHLNMHHTVQMLEPEKYGKEQLDIEMSNIKYFPDGFSIQLTARDKDNYYRVCYLTGYVILVDKIKPGEEEEE